MNLTTYYKKYILILIFLPSLLPGKLLKPVMNGEEKEILIINKKRRLYFPIKSDPLEYKIEGPMRLEFISRYPVLKKKQNKSISYSYKIVIDQKDTVNVNHRFKVQKTIKSIQHPKHKYTYSGNYFINLEKGKHTLKLLENKKQKYPVLIRLISKEFESLGKNKKIIKPTIAKNSIKLKSNNKELTYYECSSKLPIEIKVKKNKTFRILSRLEFSESMGPEESYRIRIKENNKVVGTYYFNTERSPSTLIKGYLDKVPGKWRSCEIPPAKKDQTYLIEIADRDKVVFTRFMLY